MIYSKKNSFVLIFFLIFVPVCVLIAFLVAQSDSIEFADVPKTGAEAGDSNSVRQEPSTASVFRQSAIPGSSDQKPDSQGKGSQGNIKSQENTNGKTTLWREVSRETLTNELGEPVVQVNVKMNRDQFKGLGVGDYIQLSIPQIDFSYKIKIDSKQNYPNGGRTWIGKSTDYNNWYTTIITQNDVSTFITFETIHGTYELRSEFGSGNIVNAIKLRRRKDVVFDDSKTNPDNIVE